MQLIHLSRRQLRLIKTLQNLPIAAKMVFTGTTSKETRAIGRQIAKEVPGYSARDDNTRPDDDSSAEIRAIYSGLAQANTLKRVRSYVFKLMSS